MVVLLSSAGALAALLRRAPQLAAPGARPTRWPVRGVAPPPRAPRPRVEFRDSGLPGRRARPSRPVHRAHQSAPHRGRPAAAPRGARCRRRAAGSEGRGAEGRRRRPRLATGVAPRAGDRPRGPRPKREATVPTWCGACWCVGARDGRERTAARASAGASPTGFGALLGFHRPTASFPAEL